MIFYRIRRRDGKYYQNDWYGSFDTESTAKIFKSKAGVTIKLKQIRNGEENFDPSRYIIEKCILTVQEGIPLEDW